jgi:hypothetical protein
MRRAALAALAVLAACETIPPEPVPLTDIEIGQLNAGLEAAPVAVGDQFLFDNPAELWEVAVIDGPFVVWRNNAGDEQQMSYNAMLPALRWTGATKAGQRQIAVTAGGLFPLAQGNTVDFLVDGRSARPPASWRAEWHCEVQEQAETVVTAGKAEVWRILCRRNGKERFVFDYDPAIGHYVRIVAASFGAPVVRQLTAYSKGGGDSRLRMPEPAADGDTPAQ